MSKKIAILGANSHIAKGLIEQFFVDGSYELFLFGRTIQRIESFVNIVKRGSSINHIHEYDLFSKYDYDVIINCVGLGTPVSLKAQIRDIFSITEKYDNMVFDYLRNVPSSLYINLSSGAVYGNNFVKPVNLATCSLININSISEGDYYGIAKLNSEIKHRSNERPI